MGNIERKFEQWSKKLYDISKKNYMINFKGQHNRTVKLVSPSMDKLFDSLVNNEKTLSFKRNITRDNNFYVFAVSTLLNSLGNRLSFKEGDIDVETHKDKDAYEVLRNIKRVSNDFKLEQGIDVLHITFGYIRWKPEGSVESYTTPLINVPVTLEQENINSLYTISKVSEPEINPILKYMLEKQNITLPELGDKNISEYLKEIDEIANLNGWEIIEEATLCILFFQKMVMFRDLEKNKQRIFSHPIIKSFCDEEDETYSEDDLIFNHDEEDERNRLLVVEADSSQMDALSLAEKGKSFVLQGPPGTGKSQTITNIIAQAIGQGKKVLFVSQKTAALEVVYNKLKQADLQEFVLPLHNIKSNKAKIVNDIYAPYELNKTIVKEEKLNELERMQVLKNEINKYAKSIGKKVYKLDMNFHDVIDQYYQVSFAQDGDFSIPSIVDISKSKLNSILANIRMYEQQYNDYKQKSHECYEYTTITSLTFDEKEKLENSLSKAYDKIGEIVEIIDNINYYLPEFYTTFSEAYEAMSSLAKLVNLNVENIDPSLINQVDKVTEVVMLQDIIERQRNDILEYFNESIFQENLEQYTNELKETFDEVINNCLYFNNHNHKFVIENIDKYKNALNEINKINNQLTNATTYLIDLLSIDKNLLYSLDYQEILTVLNYDMDAFDIKLSNNPNIIKDIETIIKKQKELENQKNTVLHYALPSILDIDYGAIKNYKYILSEQTNSFALLFNSAKRKLREDVVETISVHLKDSSKVSSDKVLSILDLLVRYHELNLEHSSMLAKLRLDYDLSYATTPESLLNNIYKANKIIKAFNGIEIDKIAKAYSMSHKNYVKEYFLAINQCNESLLEYKKEFYLDLNSIFEDSINHAINKALVYVDQLRLLVKNQQELSLIERYYFILSSYQKNINNYNKKTEDLAMLYGIEKSLYSKIINNQNSIKVYQEFADKYELELVDLIDKISSYRNEIKNEIVRFTSLYEEANKSYNYLKSLFKEEKQIDKYSNGELLRFIDDCYNNTSSLKAKFSFENGNKEYENDEYLSSFISWCRENNIKGELTNIYLRKFYSKVILSYVYDNDTLQFVDKVSLESKINEFNNLCKEQFEISKAIIRSNCLERIPSLKTNLASNDERSYLIREHQRTRKQSIRKLFDSIPHLLLDLKPCLMMSPLTVSNYLENDNYVFDMVVFDEASQIRPEEAINSIYRGKQIIIAGDSKQLPPTNFFNKKEDEVDEDEEDDIILESLDESILEYATKKLPSITLLWHYRSKNEHLIEFSNKSFYNNDLITFPNSTKKADDFGVEYVYVNGIYQKGKRMANVIEAEKVLDLIDEHIEKYGTTRSLGVIAFGERQRYTIDKALHEYRKQMIDDKRYEEFFSSDLKEPFFIKNIENVQGDERDTIIFSVGYGHDENGVFRYNFGPLQQSGGERRLNVAISRAKLNLKVVASFTPDEIDLTRVESIGVKLFKKYLTFAYLSNKRIENINPNTNNGIKGNIAKFLMSYGYDVIVDYGYSSFKIDVAVIDKNNKNNFICAILLDNEAYINEKSCKDREILKKEILQANGWKCIRIYSKFYIENEKQENIDLLKFINSNYVNEDNEEKSKLSDYVTELESSVESINYGFDNFVPFDYSSYLDDNISIEGTLLSINEKLVKQVLNCVGVIHLNELINQIADAFKVGEHRAKNRVLRIINDEDFVRDRMFVYLKGYDTSKVKKVTGDYKRNLEYVHPNEIKNCLITILENSIGLTRDGLTREAMIVFGIKNKSSRVNDFFNVHVNRLLADKLITEVDGMLAINKEDNSNG